MKYPQYNGNTADINLIKAVSERLNPFANLKIDESKDSPIKSMRDDFNAFLANLAVLADPSAKNKDLLWTNIMNYLQQKADAFNMKNVEDITKEISDSSKLKEWELSTLCRNILNQTKVMQSRGELEDPEHNKDLQELSEKHSNYNKMLEELGDDFAQYESYRNFSEKLEETAKNEKRLKFEFEKYQQQPNIQYINKTVEKTINGKIEQFNYKQIYELYDNEAKKTDRFIKEAQEQIDQCFEKMKAQLKALDEDVKKELEGLQLAIKNGKKDMADLTKNVLETIEVGNIESKLAGDVHTIDEYFETLDKEIADRPIIAIKSKTRQEKNYQLSRKAYLEGLRLKDKYVEGATDIEKQLIAIKSKYCSPYGKTLDEMVREAQLAKDNGMLDLDLSGVDPKHADADKALMEFNRLKEDFITLYSVYSDNKNFQKQVRNCKVPSDFINRMSGTVNKFEEDFINPILFKEQNDKALSDYEKKVNEGCQTLNSKYSQMKETKKQIERCNSRIQELNTKKIDPSLLQQKKLTDLLTLDKFAKYGIKPDIDLKALYQQLQSAEIRKESYEYERDKYTDLKDNYIREEQFLKDFEANKKKYTEEYRKIKGSTAKMNEKNDKMLNVWKEYKELQMKNQAAKENIFDKNNTNNQTYGQILDTIAAELQRFKDTARVGRDSIFKDSDAYTKMIKSVDNLLAPREDEFLSKPKLKFSDPAEVKDALDKIAAASKQYLDAKAKQWRLFPSTQRVTRLTFANNLMTLAGAQGQNIMKIQEKMMGIQNESLQTYAKVETELSKDKINDPEDFFEHIIKPRAKNAEKEKLQNKEIVQNIPEKKNPEENTAENSKELNSFVK